MATQALQQQESDGGGGDDTSGGSSVTRVSKRCGLVRCTHLALHVGDGVVKDGAAAGGGLPVDALKAVGAGGEALRGTEQGGVGGEHAQLVQACMPAAAVSDVNATAAKGVCGAAVPPPCNRSNVYACGLARVALLAIPTHLQEVLEQRVVLAVTQAIEHKRVADLWRRDTGGGSKSGHWGTAPALPARSTTLQAACL